MYTHIYGLYPVPNSLALFIPNLLSLLLHSMLMYIGNSLLPHNAQEVVKYYNTMATIHLTLRTFS